MRYFTAIACFLLPAFTLNLSAQQDFSFLDDITERACPYDTTVTGFFTNQYAVYLTLDDTYEGTVDSSWCPVFTYDGARNRYELQLEDFDFGRPIFVKLRYPIGEAPALEPYRSYELYGGHGTREVFYREDPDCPGDCTQIHLAYTMVDPEAADTLQRRFELDGDYAYINGASCFFSERYPQQRLDEIGQTIWLARNGNNPRLLFDYGYVVQELEGQTIRSEVDSIIFRVETLNESEYSAFPTEVTIPVESPEEAFEGTFYLPQTTDRRPGENAIRYTDVFVEHNPDTMVNMRLLFERFNDIAFPPYTDIRGAKVTGQDSLRHRLTIEFIDFYFGNCASLFVERPIPTNTYYELGSDTIAFGQDGSCFILESSGGIIIRPGSNLQYGLNGQGMLGARKESSITIATGATLTFNNTLRLLHPISFPEGGMHVYLAEGSTLRFGEMANVERKHAAANVWVYIHGKEENVDFGPLTPEERALFVFVDAPVRSFPLPLQEVHAYPNPVLAGNTISLLFPRPEPERQKAYALYSPQGRTIVRGELSINNDNSADVTLPLHLAGGVYTLRVHGNERSYNVSLVIGSLR